MNPVSSPRTARALLTAFLAFLALVGFWPSPVDKPLEGHIAGFLHLVHRLGAPVWFDYGFIEASANVALFVPLGFLAVLGFPTKRWWQLAGLGMLISGCMELGQFLFLHSRCPSALDVATNTTGGLLGIVMASALQRRAKGHLQPAASTPDA